MNKIQTYIDKNHPYVMILIGPPLVGKSTFCNELAKNGYDFDLISRDQIVLDIHGSNDYNLAFKSVNQKEVDSRLISKIVKSNSLKNNVIIDMTNMTRKRRKYNLSFFGKGYKKIAIVFPILSDLEFEKRNEKRKELENKFIPMNIIKNMISSYQTIDDSEGFDKIFSI